jgi:hypothetical protein
MKDVRLRTIFATVCAAAVCLAFGATPNAATTSPIIAHFAAKAPYVGDPGAPAHVDIMIERWSTDKDLEKLRGALGTDGAPGVLLTLQGMIRRAGVVLIPGVQASGARARLRHPFNVYFAKQIETPKGRQVILGADHYLAFGQPTAEWSEDFEFSLLDIRIGADGTGVGKVARAGDVAYNQQAKTIEIADYAKIPVQLTQVKLDMPAGRIFGAKQ